MAGLASGSGMVLVNNNPRYARALVRIEELMLGVLPGSARKSVSADRAIYRPGPSMSRLIINVAAVRITDRIGWHATARTFDVHGAEARIDAAERVAQIFRDEGLEPCIFNDAELEYPPNFLIFITAPFCTHAILLGPTEEEIGELPPEIRQQLPPPGQWTMDIFCRGCLDFEG